MDHPLPVAVGQTVAIADLENAWIAAMKRNGWMNTPDEIVELWDGMPASDLLIMSMYFMEKAKQKQFPTTQGDAQG